MTDNLKGKRYSINTAMWQLILLALIGLGGYSFSQLLPTSAPWKSMIFSLLLVASVPAFVALALLPLRDKTRFISKEFYRGIIIALSAAGLMGLVFLFLNRIW